jgi:hypothetical protein
MLALGVEYRSLWWLGCGLAVGAVGLLFMVGNPLAEPVLDVRESWRREPATTHAPGENPADTAHH